jgi:hypothetical protein
MSFRYRLVDPEGSDLGPFVSKRQDWKQGERLGRSKGEDMVITAVIEPEGDADFEAYLVVSPVGGNGASHVDNANARR